MRSLFGKLFRRLGYQPIPLQLLGTLGGVGHAIHLRDILQRQEIDCVFDVGANRGQFRDLLRNTLRFTGTIISFEPLPNLAAILSEKTEGDPHWHIFPYALGSKDATETINVTAGDDLSSLLQPKSSTELDWQPINNAQIVDTYEVKVCALDGIFDTLKSRYGFKRPLLKADTQGYDLEVFKGAGKKIEEFVAIQSELAFRPIYDAMPLYSDTLAFLERRRFALSGVYPITLDDFMRLIESDGIFINERLARRKKYRR